MAVELKINGRLFPSYILANFKKFKLSEITKNPDEDPCALKKGQKTELRTYQKFLSAYLDYKSPYRDILVYYLVGAGKTYAVINVYNMLYNYNPAFNVIILTKASLREHPWITELEKFLSKDDYDYRFKNIVFISYDSPIADKQFLETVKMLDSNKKSLYIIDEAHNFIRNVYSNISSGQGKRAHTIYDYIINDKRENDGVRVILMSGTPAINKPFELALLFNLLRPNIFPKSESQFNQLFVSTTGYQTISDSAKNMFQRRIMGLVTYYIGATPDLYASQTTNYIDIEMSNYQTDMYTHFEEIEEAMDLRRKTRQGGGEHYKSYTRQASNFVFPQINQWVTGENRPRPSQFKIEERDGLLIDEGKGKLKLKENSVKQKNIHLYLKKIDEYVNAYMSYLEKINDQDVKNGYTLVNDVKKYHETYGDNYEEFQKNEKQKSGLYESLYECSAKFLYAIFLILKSPGPVLVYSNYVTMEGLQIFKIYLHFFGFSAYTDQSKGEDGFRYSEFHGGIDSIQRSVNLKTFNVPDNKHGKISKIMMISPAGAEGISLSNIRQVHIIEPFWNETRIVQMIGRAIRQCSHKDLPMSERHVEIYRYKSVRKKSSKITTDQYIENLARGKEGLIQSFFDAIKEVAVDCVLNKPHNMLAQEYKCFQFDEPSLFEEQIGPAYKEDIYDDERNNNGSNNLDSVTTKIKVNKINAVVQTSPNNAEVITYSDPQFYWYSPETNVVYDFDLHYAIGKVGVDEDDLPLKLDKDTYIINLLIPIPLL